MMNRINIKCPFIWIALLPGFYMYWSGNDRCCINFREWCIASIYSLRIPIEKCIISDSALDLTAGEMRDAVLLWLLDSCTCVCGMKMVKPYGKSVSQAIDKHAYSNLLHVEFSYSYNGVLFWDVNTIQFLY